MNRSEQDVRYADWAKKQMQAARREVNALWHNKASYFNQALRKCHCWPRGDTACDGTERLRFMYQGSDFSIMFHPRRDQVMVVMNRAHIHWHTSVSSIEAVRDLVKRFNTLPRLNGVRYTFAQTIFNMEPNDEGEIAASVIDCYARVNYEYFVKECDAGLYAIFQELYDRRLRYQVVVIGADDCE